MMGDFGGPLLSTMESALSSSRTKSGALHVENSQSPLDSIHSSPAMERLQVPACQDAKRDDDMKPVDTPMQNSNAVTESNTPAEPATPTSEHSPKPLPEQMKAKDFAAKASESSRPATGNSNSSSNFKPATPIRDYGPHPRLWIDDGPKAGKAIADWRLNYVPIFEEATKDMDPEERTRYFDRLVREDPDRYCQALATFYTVHPELIPDREPDAKTLKRIEEAFKEVKPKVDMAQKRIFKEWDNWGPRTGELAPEMGPKNESTPDDEIPECEHCIKEAKKSKSLIRKVFRKMTLSDDKSTSKPATRRATESSIKPPDVKPSIADDNDQTVEGASNHSGSSSDVGKEREALTETGVGTAKAIHPPKKRTSIVQKLRLSTVHTR